jgi:flagellar biosynthesis/type III secretory pathway chaperone
MDEKVTALVSIIDDVSQCYSEMQRILSEEAQSISIVDRKRFERILKKKARLVEKIKTREQIRQAAVDRLATAYQLQGNAVTLRRLARQLPPPDAEKVIASATALRRRIAAVREQNRLNRERIRRCVALIDSSLKLLTALIDSAPIYRNSGKPHLSGGYDRSGGRIFCGTG